jgi:hypothetical protein
VKALGRVGWALALLVGSMACGAHPRVSDTGYVGTWQRGDERARSTIAIVKQGSRYLFRWSQTSADNRWSVRCGWEGKCEEVIDGEKVADYNFRTWIDETTGRLVVECSGRVIKPKDMIVHDVDHLEVEPGGTSLGCHTVERNGQHFAVDGGPARWFKKISDSVVDPP